MFLKYLKDDPEEKESWLLIYRAENREERNYESGWFFVQKNPDSETKAEYMKGVFSIEKQRMVMEDVARNVGFDPKEIRSRSINEVLYDMTVAKELIPENSVEGIWREASGSSFLVRMSNGHPTAINIVDVPWEKAGMCVAR